MKNFKLILLVLTSLSVGTMGFAQLTTSTALSPAELVESVLVGDGVTVSGVTYTGDAEAIGSFNGASTNLGLNSGIILTTGTVKNEVGGLGGEQRGPFGPNDTGSAGKANGQPGYGALTSIAGVETENAAILEFDFVPLSDTVRFRYVFGSDEYPEFVGEGYNDVFAFFISGPGFGGTYNMAQIPGGGGPVSIDNINNGPTNSGPCQNCEFYIENGTGDEDPFASSEFYIQYDGFTTVMEAVAEVQCGETYHLRIAIADAGDEIYDSGIFLEANSLASYAPLEMSANLDFDGYGDGTTMAEGCETATVTVKRSYYSESLDIPVVVTGSATEGVDFSDIPDNVFFPAGVSTVTFSFDAFLDELDEGIEDLKIELNHPDPCGEDNFVSIDMAIRDVDPLEISVENKEVYCPGDEVELEVVVSGGLPEYTYDWSIGGSEPSITITPEFTAIYGVTVNDECIGEPVMTFGTVFVPDYPPLGVNTSPDTSVLCPNTPNVLYAEPFGGEGSYAYEWYANEELIGTGTFVNVSPMVTTTYTIIVTDGCGNFVTKEITITVEASVLELEMSPDQVICPGDSTEIYVIATEGLGDYTYYWLHSGETTSSITVTPYETTSYTVSVEDACHTYDIKGTTTVEVIQPIANFDVLTRSPMEGLRVSFRNTSVDGVSWDWDLGNGESSSEHSPTAIYRPADWYDVTLIAYNEIGCSDTITKPIYIKPEFFFYAPNAFTPADGRFNNSYGVSIIGATDFEFHIFNRWGELIYYTNDRYFQWDGTYKDEFVADGVYVYKAKVADQEFKVHEFEGIITVLR